MKLFDFKAMKILSTAVHYSILTYCFVSLIYPDSLYSQTGWYWQNQTLQTNNLTDVFFVIENTGYAVGSGSTVLKTNYDIVSGDSLKKGSAPVITFDDSKLSTINVRMVFNELFRQYLTIKDALVYNDPYNAKRNTLKLLDDMRSKTKDFYNMETNERWMFFLSNFNNIRRKVESAGFITEQRSLFSEITDGLGYFMRHFGLYDKKIYLMKSITGTQYGNNEWFSDSKDNKNPYLGKLNDTVNVKIKEIWKFK